MTGREKIDAAFSPEGNEEIPGVICYERLFVRDHLPEFGQPWWYWHSPDSQTLMKLRRSAIESAGLDWLTLWQIPSRKEREGFVLESRKEGVFKVDAMTGVEEQIYAPQIGGTVDTIISSMEPKSREDVERLIPVPNSFNAAAILADGRGDLAIQAAQEYDEEKFPIYLMSSPLWSCFDLWGFEATMMLIATRPDLIAYACERKLTLVERLIEEAAAVGARGIWIEECFTDGISPDAYRAINLPLVRRLIEHIRGRGLRSIYYYCGSPEGKLDMILDAGADGVAFEEGKKNFSIDIDDIISQIRGRCTVLGNMDSIGVLQDGTDEQLRAEIKRQIAAGRRNKSRFIMSIGSPVTPATPVRRVRQYCDLVRELGK